MAYQTLSEFNGTGLSGLLQYNASVIDGFSAIFLTLIFIFVFSSLYYGQKRTTGHGNFKGSYAVASFFLIALATVMSLITGLVPTYYVVICFINCIIAVTILLNTE